MEKVTLKEIVKEFFDLHKKSLPHWLKFITQKDSAILKSYLWSSDYCDKIRLCEIEIENKFVGETLIIYPNSHYELPIFGCEYLIIGNKKYFGAIDFHPISENQDYLQYLEMFSDKKLSQSKHYDMNQYFSSKLWADKRDQPFYNDYQILVKCYLHQYQKMLKESHFKFQSYKNQQKKYNSYMIENDPAFGVLKSYFGEEFATKYLNEFLFCI